MAKLNENLTVGGPAALFGVSRDTARRWDRAGKLKARRHPITGDSLYIRKELDGLLRGILAAKGAQPSKRRKKKANKGD